MEASRIDPQKVCRITFTALQALPRKPQASQIGLRHRDVGMSQGALERIHVVCRCGSTRTSTTSTS
jgi:hypothetical protein